MSLFQSITIIISAATDAATTSHTTRTPCGPTNGPPPSQSTDDDPGQPIYFYDSDKPYYEFTSFSDHPVEYHGRSYRTAEHLFQALKFMNTNPALAERIRMLPTARMAQQEAKKQIRHQRVDWLEVNVAMMEKVLEVKFKQHRHLRNLLRSTGSRELIEDSPIDWFWGIGSDGHGRNELGKALIRLRERLQAGRRH
ncbi:DUF1768-domain-containing protein [Lactarius akahatsu]|uniref:DUF1768-domain-containing protein n=1 Tax=Lactarius akahatsu TaxID=416441 RepID=A0AAD4LLT4_9AGAM|nr:DUF1768-domain-containing protein [Lactarius akahatsu]